MSNVKISGFPVPFALPVGTPNGTEAYAADQTVGGVLQTVSVTVAALFGGASIVYTTGSGLSVTGAAASNYNLAMNAVAGQSVTLTISGNGNAANGIVVQQDNTSTGYLRNLAGTMYLGAGSQNALQINTAGNIIANLPTSGGALMVQSNAGGFGGYGDGMTVNAQSSGEAAGYSMSSNSIGRWTIGKNQSPESGSNLGSDLGIYAFADNGAYLGNPLSIVRASGTVTINAYSGASLVVYGTSGNAAQTITGYNGTGVSDGLFISSGTNSSDYALAVANRANSAQFMKLYGDGSGQLGPGGSGLSWSAGGAYAISAPSTAAATALTINAQATGSALVVNQGSSANTNGLGLSLVASGTNATFFNLVTGSTTWSIRTNYSTSQDFNIYNGSTQTININSAGVFAIDSGIISSSSYTLKFANVTGQTYGSVQVNGATGGYTGVMANDGTSGNTLMSSATINGMYLQTAGRWICYDDNTYFHILKIPAFDAVSTTTTAPAAGGAGALPATPKGYVTITINNTSRQIAYY